MNDKKNKKERMANIEQRRSEIEKTIQQFQRLILEQDHKIEDLENAREQEIDSIFKDLLSVIDAFDKADARLQEKYPDNKEVSSARTRFATAKNKLCAILENNGVAEIQFNDGMATLQDCQVEDTEPDASRPNDTIISIEKAGYRRNGRLLRRAEVIVVKN